MNKLISLVNVFALLSILAVGGGTAVLPQMKHEVVGQHHWQTAEQFTDVYSLGQLAPGPNMNMVTIIGYHVAGPLGALLVLLAFYIPSCTLAFTVGKIWDHFEGSPWRDAVQRGMAPITVGLMLSGVYAIGKTATFNLDASMRRNIVTGAITLAVTAILLLRRINPALLILVGGAVGWLTLRFIS
ncbi:MAG TPA: chromate transporter [Candidatus Binataceae bacterium]|nr:chromate transporter [Candidatus Binataceae bacterium]